MCGPCGVHFGGMSRATHRVWPRWGPKAAAVGYMSLWGSTWKHTGNASWKRSWERAFRVFVAPEPQVQKTGHYKNTGGVSERPRDNIFGRPPVVEQGRRSVREPALQGDEGEQGQAPGGLELRNLHVDRLRLVVLVRGGGGLSARRRKRWTARQPWARLEGLLVPPWAPHRGESS